MAKKTETMSNADGSETAEVEVLESVEVKPAEVSADFGRADLNALRDAVNFLLRKA